MQEINILVPKKQNNDTATTTELSSLTVTQTEDGIMIESEQHLNQSVKSFQKLNTSVINLVDIETNQDNLFLLMNFCMLKSLINQICVCRSCNGDNLEIHYTDKKGLSLQFSIEYNDCDWIYKSFLPLNSNFNKKIPGERNHMK